jgi:hypothetical protein
MRNDFLYFHTTIKDSDTQIFNKKDKHRKNLIIKQLYFDVCNKKYIIPI